MQLCIAAGMLLVVKEFGLQVFATANSLEQCSSLALVQNETICNFPGTNHSHAVAEMLQSSNMTAEVCACVCVCAIIFASACRRKVAGNKASQCSDELAR